jgi:hypothetical protein
VTPAGFFAGSEAFFGAAGAFFAASAGFFVDSAGLLAASGPFASAESFFMISGIFCENRCCVSIATAPESLGEVSSHFFPTGLRKKVDTSRSSASL